MICRASIPARLAAMAVLLTSTFVCGEDGSRLWLRYPDPRTGQHARQIVVQGKSATCDVIRAELSAAQISGGEAIIVGPPENSELVRSLNWDAELKRLGSEGFVVRS